MAKLMIQLTPPRPDDPSAKMSPQDWIEHPDDTNAAASDGSRLTMFLAKKFFNLIKKVAKLRGEKLPKGDNDTEHSTNRYQRYADNMPDDEKAKAAWKKEFKFDGQYLITLKNVKPYQEHRNEAALETEHDLRGFCFRTVIGTNLNICTVVRCSPGCTT